MVDERERKDDDDDEDEDDDDGGDEEKENAWVVIRNGSAYIQAGRGGDDAPRAVFVTVVGIPKINNPENVGETYIGEDAIVKRGISLMRYPFEGGLITDWEMMEQIWKHTFYEELRVVPEKQPLLITDNILSTKEQRERITQVMFETFNVPALYIENTAVLTLYASGRTTGIVLEIDDDVAHASVVYEGYVLPHTVCRAAASGQQLLEYMWKQPVDSRWGSQSCWGDGSWMRDLARDILFTNGQMYVAVDYEAELLKDCEDLKQVVYSTPTAGEDTFMSFDRFRIPEILFKPSIAELEGKGIQQAVYDAIMSLDPDIDRKDVYGNIVLSGQASMFEGIADRLQKEIVPLAPAAMEPHIKVVAPPERKISAWIGGSILSGLSAFEGLYIKSDCPEGTCKGEGCCYSSTGPTIIHRSCFNFC